MKVMILLVGEQPIPNLLPLLHEELEEALLVYTSRTQAQMERLRDLLSGRCKFDELLVSAFDIADTQAKLGARLTEKDWRGKNAIFNLTGGTKTMAFAAYELAVRLGSDFLYFQTEGVQSLIYHYTTSGGPPILSGPPQMVGTLLTIDDYLRVYVGNYSVNGFSPTDGGKFEEAVYKAIQPVVDECLAGIRFSPTVEVDLVVRCGNQVGVAEIKMGKPNKDGIDQLTAACGREYLGIYTKRLLISARSWENLDELKDLANARGVELIELPSYHQTGTISVEDIETLRLKVKASLRCA
jgi:hypothetical protein